MLSQLVILVIYQVLLFDKSTAQTDYYPCYSADCVPGKYCHIAERSCVLFPCSPDVKCTDTFPTNRICMEGSPVLEMFGNKEIECSSTRACPVYTDCINGRCCWVGPSSDNPVSTVPPLKAGNCPDVTGLFGACFEGCSGDHSCPGSQKCCSNGCGRSCIDPVTATKTVTKPGTCPRPTVPSSICSIGTRRCITDNECPSTKKCCSTSCGRTCQNTIESSVRPGICPRVSSLGTCVNRCNFDGNCPEGQKCCSNGCGRSCMTTVELSSPRPGQCPALPASTTCFKECSYDSDCSGTMKCCRNGCGKVCTPIQSAIRNCPQMMNLFFFCYFNNRCIHDLDCQTGESCCMSKACGRVCMANFNQLPSPELPIISYPSQQHQRCTWWKFMYGQCRW